MERKPKVIDENCVGCSSCIAVCPVDAITINADGKAVIDQDLCINCGLCIEVCPHEAITRYLDLLKNK